MKSTKKFSSLILAAFFVTSVPLQVSAAENTININQDYETSSQIYEDVFSSLPVAKGKYKSRQRPILIEGAMNSEVGLLIKSLKNPVMYRHLQFIYIAGTYKDYPVVIARTEIVMANAAASTALGLIHFNPIAVINQGTAGGHDKNLKNGDIVIGEKSFDFTAYKTAYQPEGAGFKIEEQELLGTYAYDEKSDKFQAYNEYFADEKLLEIAESITGFNSVKGTIGTSNAWLNGIDHINFLNKKYG